MRLVQEIRSGFASLRSGRALPLTEVGNYPAYVLRIGTSYGVVIEVSPDVKINERFSNVRYATEEYEIDGRRINFLYLSSDMEHLRNEFANICGALVDPGEKGIEREKIVKAPLKWWEQMKELLGNRNVDSSPYNVLGEMVAYYYLITNGKEVNWIGQINGSVDFESNDMDYEVKSTTMRYDSMIQISSQFQLQAGKDIKIFFLRFEESAHGTSIDDLVEMLVKAGADRNKIEESLICGGYEKYSTGRNRKYKLLEMRLYDVNERFPTIIRERFADYGIPQNVVKINYTIDLDGLEYKDLTVSLI
ncbi:PD-(D/E)XK motif protein [Lederbergia citri]|uniref:PD-(D/E)XK motif protein n=1 Tax=Lederbergia citri TaxID=2833580 RepID=A0A942YI15_9BACI|nr:PD-(D/E)XK motif protein [Lederbergia citri]MBS4196444.1 PD-(D/E)XK motif protein [Lederbergia citri]